MSKSSECTKASLKEIGAISDITKESSGNSDQLLNNATNRFLMTQVESLLTAIDLIRTGKVCDDNKGHKKYLDGVVNTAKMALTRSKELER